MSIIGLVAAGWVWVNVNPFLGIVVGFLFVGGLGWQALGHVAGSTFGALRSPKTAKKAYGDNGKAFIAAWEERFGRITPGSDNHPPPGTFQAWLEANKNETIAPGDWIDQQRSRPTTAERERASSPNAVHGLCELLGILGTADYPTFFFIADDAGFAVHNHSGSKFLELTWREVSVASETDSGWIFSFDEAQMPVPFVTAISVSQTDTPGLLSDYIYGNVRVQRGDDEDSPL